jgi:hypothetical protein
MADEGNGGRRPLISIDKETRILVPLGAIAALGFVLWSAGAAWRDIGRSVEDHEARLARHEAVPHVSPQEWEDVKKRLWIAEKELLDIRLGRPVNVIPDPRGRSSSDGPGAVQDHQVRIAGGSGGEDRDRAGSGGVARDVHRGAGGGADLGVGGVRGEGALDRADAHGLSPAAASLLTGAPLVRPGW